MSGWEELDTAGHTFWLVCFGEDYSIKPDAIFLSEEEAQAYVASRQALPEDDDRHVGKYDILVLPVRDLAGVAWNSYDPLPEEGGARPGSDRQLRAEVSRLQSLLNTPEVVDFVNGVQIEAAHQRERWGADHDVGKAPADWFWLVGYLAGKALHAFTEGRQEKALHHLVTTGAALANWHAHATGADTSMRPGIDHNGSSFGSDP